MIGLVGVAWEGSGLQIMRPIVFKIVTAALAGSVLAAVAAHAESPAVRNCTWCHGALAHGYSPAPGLAGQQYQYLSLIHI